MILLGDKFYKFGCALSLTAFGSGLIGATVVGVLWAFENGGLFFGFLALAVSGVVWAGAIDTMYRFWGMEEFVVDAPRQSEFDNGYDP